MLLERLSYLEDFPLNITVAQVENDPIHYHPDIEFIYVLQGKVQLKNGYYVYDLKEGDIFTNAGNEVHSIKGISDDNVVAQIQVSTKDFSQYFPRLSSACYRTYSKKPHDKRHQILKDLMLQLLATYEKKGFNYKSECLYIAIEVIKHLDKNFNLFTFEKGMVVGFDRGNQVTVDRISRISTYIYQNYKNNISLNDLSEMEFLSSFYLSHLIKDYTGMNFREFLSFARVEMSEIPLLESNKKISQVAREVGFSATSYYNKYFKKWFGHSPETHRKMYKDEVKSDLNPAVMNELPQTKAIALVRQAQSDYNSKHKSKSMVTSLNMDVDVDAKSKPSMSINKDLHLILTLDDYDTLGGYILEALKGLHPKLIHICKEQGKTAKLHRLQKILAENGFKSQLTALDDLRKKCKVFDSRSYAYDSIAYPIYLMKNMLENPDDRTIIAPLRDQYFDSEGLLEDERSMLKGMPSLITSKGIKKPSYFAYTALSRIKGDVISMGNYHAVIKHNSSNNSETGKKKAISFTILVCNYNEALNSICTKDADPQEVKNSVNGFLDELNLNMSLIIPTGLYHLVKYNLTKENNLFAHLSALDFKDEGLFPFTDTNVFSGWPVPETYIEDVRTLLNINFYLKGANIQMATIIKQ